LYGLSALVNVWLLQIMPYSVVVPLGAVCYIWTMFLSKYLLDEQITTRKMTGVCCIIGGTILLAL
ncbi:MAG: EamA family transporter, partial [Clostridia bacterium]